MIRLGRVAQLARYPVKSMAGTTGESAEMGWHGFNGDRRFAFRRLEPDGRAPWLTASRLPGLILYRPFGEDAGTGEPLPTHVRTPRGNDLELRGEALREEIAGQCGVAVELVQLAHGIFDEASISVISDATITGIGNDVGAELDRRRFRANIVLETDGRAPFLEDGWVGGTLVFGDDESAPAVAVTSRDVRCVMINLDPETAKQDARVLKSVVQLNATNAGVYGSVVRPGTLHVGQSVSLVTDGSTQGRAH